jgi:hypothetical protein
LSVSNAPSSRTPPHPRWFWINVVSLCLLAPWATYWFQQHLKLYFTGIVIVGGAFSIWALFQAMWGFLQKSAKVDTWEHSRKLLAKPDVTAILFIAAAILLVLWYYTASLYITYEGAAKEGEYLIEVVREPDSSPMLAPVSLTAGTPVAGRPFFWQSARSKLVCRILRPTKYEVLPCSLDPGHSTRILVPGSFNPREFHLLRIVPGGRLYTQLASVEDAPVSIKELELEVRGERAVLKDIRRQVVYTGADEEEMPIVMALEQPGALAPYLRNRLLAKSDDVLNADRTTAILSLATRTWPTFYLQKGDRVTFTVRVAVIAGGSRVLEGFPVHYTVTADKVQTVWLPE